MTFYRRAAVAAAALALTGVSLFSAPQQASAGVPPTPEGPSAKQVQDAGRAKPANCPASSLCMYNDANYYGGQDNRLARANGTCDGVAYNDQISSIWNGSGKSVRFYNDAGCTGQAYSLPNGSGSAYLTITHPTQSDEITSFKWGA